MVWLPVFEGVGLPGTSSFIGYPNAIGIRLGHADGISKVKSYPYSCGLVTVFRENHESGIILSTKLLRVRGGRVFSIKKKINNGNKITIPQICTFIQSGAPRPRLMETYIKI